MLGAAVDLESALGESHRVGRGVGDEISVGDLTVMSRWKYEELAAFPLVGAHESDVRQVALQSVLQESGPECAQALA